MKTKTGKSRMFQLMENIDPSFKNKKKLNENKDDLIGYDIPEWAVSALINGDDSGLSDEDIQKLNKFEQEVVSQYGNAHFMAGDMESEDNLGFMRSNDIDNLGSNVYRLYIDPRK
jgi:hypothetical protein